MALDTLTAANGGTPAPIAGRNTPQGFVGAAMLVNASGVEFSPANAVNQETANDALAEVSAKLDTLLGYFLEEDAPHVSGERGTLMLGVRQLADTATTDADGDRTAFKFDEEGRNKVSTKPASYSPTTGSITTNGGVVWVNCSRASNIVISMVATTLVGHNAAFEVSNNTTNGTDGNWYGMQAIRSNAGTIETSTATLAATPAYGWEVSVNGWNAFRVRATNHTSGTAAYILQLGSYATEPIPGTQALVAGTSRIGFVAGAGIWYDDSSAALTANNTFTGTSRDLTVAASAAAFANAATYARELRVSAESDVTGTLWLEVSRDNTNWRRVKSVATAAVADGGFYAEIIHQPSWRYARVGYTNGAGAQARFSIGSILIAG